MVWKYLNRLSFALLIAMGFMVVYMVTDASVRSNELTQLAEQAIQEGNDTFFISVRYFKETPIGQSDITINGSMFTMVLYETAFIAMVDEQPVIRDGFVFFLYQDSGDALPVFQVRFLTNDQELLTYQGYQFFDFGIYTAQNETSRAQQITWDQLKIDDIAVNQISTIQIILPNQVIIEQSVLLERNDFTLKASLQAYHQENQTYPSESVDGINYQQPIVIHTSQAVLRNGIIYLVVVFLLTYFLYRYRNSRLGKAKPTEGLAKDLEKLRNKEKNDA